MTELIKYVPAYDEYAYLFRVALDRIPDSEERAEIKASIQNAMGSLGVSPDNIAVQVIKSDVGPEMNTPEVGWENKSEKCLICILVKSEPGVISQAGDEIAEEIVTGFVKFSGLKPENVAAVVLENAYLEVEQRYIGPMVW